MRIILLLLFLFSYINCQDLKFNKVNAFNYLIENEKVELNQKIEEIPNNNNSKIIQTDIFYGGGVFYPNFEDKNDNVFKSFLNLKYGLNFNSYLILGEYGYYNQSISKGFWGGTYNPEQNFHTVSLLCGIIEDLNLIDIRILGGVNYISGIRRGKLIKIIDGEFLNESTEYYEKIAINNISAKLEFMILKSVSEIFSLGTSISYHFNSQYSGACLSIILKLNFKSKKTNTK